MKSILSFLFFLFSLCLTAQITLTHNVGNTPIDTGMPSCEEDEAWARVFSLSEFGISSAEQFIIKSGQVAISKSYDGASVGISVYRIDSNFPDSNPVYLGGGGYKRIPKLNGLPQIFNIDFAYPIVVPAGVERILVVAGKSVDYYNPNSAQIVIAGTQEDNADSWYYGCREYYKYTKTTNLNNPVHNANFYINVTGEVLDKSISGSQTTLTHNLCGRPIWINQFGRTGGSIKYSRTFVLEDFGVTNNEEFIINNGQVAFSGIGAWDVRIQFNIYKIDSDFPTSFSILDLIGSSQVISLPSHSDRINPITFNIDFENPVIVSKDVNRILIEVFHLPSSGYSASFIAGTEFGNDVSWLSNGLFAPYQSVNLNYYINVTGNVNHVTNNFEMNISNICSEFLKEFSVEKEEDVASVVWNFGDPASGIDNTSTDISPFHDFSVDGAYTITATVTGKDGSVEVLTETIDVKEPPNVYGIDNIYACEDNFSTGYSSSFNVATVEQQILGGQTDKVVKYIDGSGNEYDNLPNPFTNSVKNRETITVRVAHSNNPCCYSETSFDLIVNPMPDLTSVDNLTLCDDDLDGFVTFNLQQIEADIIGVETNLEVDFYYENGQQIQEPLDAINNSIVNEETITIRVINTDTDCYNETIFKLIVSPLPVANILTPLIGCDDNNDGISEYFDTSNVESEVLANQTGMDVSYFNSSGNLLPTPLPTPYTNSIVNQETITVRVTNFLTTCYAETQLVLNTASQPQISKPEALYSCDLGGGFSNFDTSDIEFEIIGSQNDLDVMYFDANGIELSSPLPTSFQNTEAWNQTIFVRVENELNSLCYNETSFDLVVNELPKVEIDETYFLCNLEPFQYVSVENEFDNYVWEYQDGSIVSNTYEAKLVNAGDYILTVGENKNGIYCENSFNFELIRSVLPKITDVKYKELSDDNYIEIIALGDGDFEYSIDGKNYQSSPVFENILGGVYTVLVRDKMGCGEDSYEVTVIDYPKYFTPNNDGINDSWQIKGITKYPNAIIYIYDRYGKLLKQINPNSHGWDGTFVGRNMASDDYWFSVELDENTKFNGHFSLKR
ncbi:T9SS type B sorting domain-containing protein [Thalassobellus citreus]|uniref:T9SS type B sorting domain-containing protein n=1 Tax=Thalassobellus citreus TaxID=3367752 RepID=UPI003795F4C0